MTKISDIPTKALPYLASRCTEYLLRGGWIDTLSYNELKHSGKHQYWQIDKPETHKITQPDGIPTDIYLEVTQNRVDKIPGSRELITKNEPIQYKVNVTEPYVAELNNVTCIGPHGLIMTDDCELLIELRNNMQSDIRHILFESYYYSPKETLSAIFNCRKGNKKDLDTVCSMLQTRAIPNNMSYGHWLLEKLPKLRGVEHYEKKTGNRVKLLIDPHLEEWQRELLSLCGKKEDDWIIWDGKLSYVDNFVLPKWERRMFCYSDIKWVANKIEQIIGYNEGSDKYPDRIYLSRQKAGRRKVQNLEEIKNMLKSFGFEIVTPENLSFETQVSMFKSAEYIVGPVGAAFSNIIFSDNVDLCLLGSETGFSIAMYFMELFEILNSNGQDIHYDCLISQGQKPEVHSDYKVPVGEFEDMLKTTINKNYD